MIFVIFPMNFQGSFFGDKIPILWGTNLIYIYFTAQQLTVNKVAHFNKIHQYFSMHIKMFEIVLWAILSFVCVCVWILNLTFSIIRLKFQCAKSNVNATVYGIVCTWCLFIVRSENKDSTEYIQGNCQNADRSHPYAF